MPTGKIKIGHRDHIISKKFYDEFLDEYPDINISYKEFVLIIRESNKEIARIVRTEQTGFKLPEGHGYLVVTSYKSNKKAVDIANSHKFGKIIYHLNLSTFGKLCAIRWYNNLGEYYYPRIYKFAACRDFQRDVSHSSKAGSVYLHWSAKDFLKFDKIIKLQNSKNRAKWES
jgi:hypothetical protein